ncbi:MAG TPA: class I SAM-dependent RNA methyltransferase [Smithella sp.]|nr:class I SAM-dependent RNA methyltransferase [Smithella sp.]
MSLWEKKSKIMITCPKGASPFLKEEAAALHFPVLEESDNHIQTEGTLLDTMRLNLHLRTAQRVLYCLKTFVVNTPELLYQKIHSMDWENILHASGEAAYFCVTSVADNPLITDTRFVNVKTKDAIVDRMREALGNRPDSGSDRSGAVIHVYWKKNHCDLYLDTSGERLSMRGYRKIPLLAPLQETLAAAVIMAAGWQREENFVNPMCGSGTLAIEAALMALGRAPGLLRDRFGFMFIKEFPEDEWRRLRQEARALALKSLPVKIIATDIDRRAVSAARKNAQAAGVENFIDFRVCHFSKTPIPDGGGVIVLNPPYGERMEAVLPTPSPGARDEIKEKIVAGKKILIRKPSEKKNSDIIRIQKIRKLEQMYRGIGDFLKKTGGNCRGYIFTGNLDMIKKIGLRTRKRTILYNGKIECRLLEYELYEGSRKHPSAT